MISRNVLIVDDSLIIIKKLKTFLEELGHNVLTAKSGQEAIDLYQAKSPDFVTMDIDMPDMDGVTALKHIIDIDPDAKVVMVTAQGQENTIMSSFKEGALDYVRKPITLQKIQDIVGRMYPHDKTS